MTGADYWADVEKTVRDMWVDYALDSLDDASDALWELAESRTVYTATCVDVMRYTDHEDAFEEVGLGECSSWSEVVCRAAFFAYREDLYTEARKWTEEDIFEVRRVFRCHDCDSVTSLEELHEYPEDDEDIQRCPLCHMDYVESLAETKDEDEAQNQGGGENG